ncbi:multiple sugar transport system substrate-binding protein [Fontibacillus solani]|uniref:Multiple sugar transport system substrate-binding protein n=1 Tax=Fontibacillus solani TaxID=1572857 RepID=A0A7W3XSK0_9BACL|nr:extracellular solute-binding protein [Fontibacillus solani]MBA9086807.1 multiple sugar transport system substrate-binding protein [Fontibacillus solani]
MKSRMLHKVLMLVVCCLLVAGCTTSKSKTEKQANIKSSIKVMFFDQGYFFQQYGDLFTVNFPNIDIQVVSTQSLYNQGGGTDYNKAMQELIDKEQPDVLMLNTDTYEKYAADGKVQELDSLINRDKYNIENIYPALIELLKEKGAGKLYGLSPSFSSNAVYYNADLFKKYGVEIPHDSMTWQEIFDLAKRFPTEGDEDTRIYGYAAQYNMSLNNMVQTIAKTQGLNDINLDTLKVTVNTESWKKVYQLALDAMESKIIYNPKPSDGAIMMEDYFKQQLFIMGRAAITTSGSYMLQSMQQAKTAIPEYKPFELGIVTGPVDSAEPDATRDIYFNEIFAINAKSPNVDAAWEFIKFINGEDYAKVKSKTMNNGLLSRMGYSTEFDGISLDVFYKLKPKLDQKYYTRAEKIPTNFYEQYNPIVEREIGLVQEKKKSLDDALKTIEEEGQVVLDKAIKEKEENKTKDATETTAE